MNCKLYLPPRIHASIWLLIIQHVYYLQPTTNAESPELHIKYIIIQSNESRISAHMAFLESGYLFAWNDI